MAEQQLDPELVEILACPETKQPVQLASAQTLEAVNARIAEGSLINRGEVRIEDPLAAGLIREDGKVLYPVRDGIPIMLIEEAIVL